MVPRTRNQTFTFKRWYLAMELRRTTLYNTIFLQLHGVRCFYIHVGIHLRHANLILTWIFILCTGKNTRAR
jgi:hypothetical protein